MRTGALSSFGRRPMLLRREALAPEVGDRFAPLAGEVEDDHHRAALAADLAADEELLEEGQAFGADPFAGGRDPHVVVHADLAHVGGRGRDGHDPQVAQENLGAEDALVVIDLPDIEIGLLCDVVHVLERVDVAEALLNRCFDRACHLIRG